MMDLEELKKRLLTLAGPEPTGKPWDDGSWQTKAVDRSVLEEAAAAIESLQRELEEARSTLEKIAAQRSSRPASVTVSDCMASLAAVCLRNMTAARQQKS